ncbi:gem-associated protein 2-like [Harmonia axyridis]|uniref:gem-associated protein 2-like n=1 Tax=Harmonia axyridis TaxID=115357 RepID=UPI001E2792A8|nr:gem-associated protein 2-like [Harmonia axyridis]
MKENLPNEKAKLRCVPAIANAESDSDSSDENDGEYLNNNGHDNIPQYHVDVWYMVDNNIDLNNNDLPNVGGQNGGDQDEDDEIDFDEIPFDDSDLEEDEDEQVEGYHEEFVPDVGVQHEGFHDFGFHIVDEDDHNNGNFCRAKNRHNASFRENLHLHDHYPSG